MKPDPQMMCSFAKDLWQKEFVRLVEGLLSKTKLTESGCVEWIAARDWNGYGSTYAFRRQWRAHRLFYMLWNGAIPKGAMILHRCDNPPCVNPAHLFVGSAKDNMQDCVKKGRALGPRGAMNGGVKLTPEQVDEIRHTYCWRSQESNMRCLAKQFGVSVSQIHCIIREKQWIPEQIEKGRICKTRHAFTMPDEETDNDVPQ